MITDYSRRPMTEQVAKVARYVRLFGFSRTLEKVRGQRHMKTSGPGLTERWVNPASKSAGPSDVALIGCGNFAFSTVGFFAAEAQPGFLRGCYDPVGTRAISLCKRYKGLYAAQDPQELIDDPKVRLIFIQSNHASHAEFAIRALHAGKSVHIEKPHVVNDDQLDRLIVAMQAAGPGKVFLGFNRPRSPHFLKIKQWLAAESGPLMINWFVAGHAIPDGHWYFAEEEGGRVLGNLCHWTDLSMHLIGEQAGFPVRVMPGTRQPSHSDFVITFDFADGSVVTISFSAKGETFEGVREYLNVHRGNALITMHDFHESTLDRGRHHERFRTHIRKHGHRDNIVNSLLNEHAPTIDTIVNSARLFLAARVAAEQFKTVEVGAYPQLPIIR